ncbi:DUF4252 domain-containing protein [Epilithonimonas lactis]|uniref:DUF4252 domain-containing protein n=1 Tax=Epilithonimonas lactis TaxID=421072 RepID=A0A085BLH6_9FLAO|nr:DUF4252 domain-containing protein [Epilithonimonas lactis]KFC23321.1 hypothetical protein IO89_01655 [Epilithonimonas lactis]WDF47063.1 DUF4252 domain-containing protein [Chryseobacterium sp. KACC 21268]SEQ09190.1 protein of unknown function [Epilithonimonas lactis]
MLRFLYIIILAVVGFFLQSCMVSHRKVHTDFFDNPGFKNNSTYLSVNVPTFLARSYVKNAMKEDGESQEVIDLVKKIKDVKVLIVESSTTPVKAEFQKYLTNNNYEEWMSLKQEGNLISLNAQQTNDVIKRMIITVRDDKDETIFVDVTGKFTADDISKIINATEKNQIKINRN